MANFKLFNSICVHVVGRGPNGPEFFATLDPRASAPAGSTFTVDFQRTPTSNWQTAFVDDPGLYAPNSLDAKAAFDAVGALYVESKTAFPTIRLDAQYPWPNGSGYSFHDYQFQSMVLDTGERYHGFRGTCSVPVVAGANKVTLETFWNGAPYNVEVLLDFGDRKQCAPDLCADLVKHGTGGVFISLAYCASAKTPSGGTAILRGPKQPPYG